MLSLHQTEGLYWLCHQRQATDEIHAREQRVLPVQDVEICGVASVWVRHHDFNRPQHSRADDEGQWFFLLMMQNAYPSQIPLSQKEEVYWLSDTSAVPSMIQHTILILNWTTEADSINLNHFILVHKAEKIIQQQQLSGLQTWSTSKNQTPPPTHPCDTSNKQCLLLSELSARVLAVPVVRRENLWGNEAASLNNADRCQKRALFARWLWFHLHNLTIFLMYRCQILTIISNNLCEKNVSKVVQIYCISVILNVWGGFGDSYWVKT